MSITIAAEHNAHGVWLCEQDRLNLEAHTDMQTISRLILAGLMLILSACATNASKSFTVDVSPIAIQYTPGQIHDFLTERGFEPVYFLPVGGLSAVLVHRDSELNEQHYKIKSAPQMEVIVRLETYKEWLSKSGPRVVVQFVENGRASLSQISLQHYKQLLAQVIKLVGPKAVRQ
jgi:hypothetical protein